MKYFPLTVEACEKAKWVPMFLWTHVIVRWCLYEVWPIGWATCDYRRTPWKEIK